MSLSNEPALTPMRMGISAFKHSFATSLISMSTSMKDLLEAGVHFGHQTQRWNPKMDKYIYTAKSGIHILDLRITYEAIEQSEDYIQKLVANSAAGAGSNISPLITESFVTELPTICPPKGTLFAITTLLPILQSCAT